MYKILTAHTASELNKMIESHIQDGWSVVGSHQVVHEQNRFAGTQHKDTIIEREYSISMQKGSNKEIAKKVWDDIFNNNTLIYNDFESYWKNI